MRAILRTIPATLLIAALAILGWTIFGESGPQGEPSGEFGIAPATRSGEGVAGTAEAAALIDPVAELEVKASGRSGVAAGEASERFRAFDGEALLQIGDAVPSPVKVGSFELEVLTRGASQPVEVEIQGGRFSVQIPERSRIRLKGGLFNGQRVRFPGLGAAFAPVDSAYALVGTPFPLNRLTVLDGPSGAHLSSLRITLAAGQSPVTLRGQADGEEVLVEDASSPIDLPWIEARTPVWLRVQADGYAPMTVWVDPQQERSRELSLWSSADLLVRVTGDGREALKTLTLFHDAGEGRTIAGGVIERRAPGVGSDGEAWAFDLVGLPALPTRVMARGIDLKARPIDLASSKISMEPGGRQTLVIQLQR